VVSIDASAAGLVRYEPFANSLTPWLAAGVKV
jgi:hypothetical protein